MKAEEFLQKAESQVKVFLADGEYKKAHAYCILVLKQIPTATTIERLKNKIEKEVKNRNKDIVEKKIKYAKTLAKEGRHSEALKMLKDAQLLEPGSSKIKQLIAKTHQNYQISVKSYFHSQLAKQDFLLEKMFDEDPEKLIRTIHEIEINSPPNRKIQELVAKYEDRYLKYAIDSKKDLLGSTRYDAINNFIENLKVRTKPKHPRIRELESRIKLKQLEDQKYEKFDFIYESKKNLDTLILLKKYPKALHFIGELEKITPDDREILQKKKKIKRILFRQNRNQVVEKIIQGFAEQEKLDKSNTIRI